MTKLPVKWLIRADRSFSVPERGAARKVRHEWLTWHVLRPSFSLEKSFSLLPFRNKPFGLLKTCTSFVLSRVPSFFLQQFTPPPFGTDFPWLWALRLGTDFPCSAAHRDVAWWKSGRLLRKLLPVRLLVAVLSRVTVMIWGISIEWGVRFFPFLCPYPPWRSTAALKLAWAVISAHDGERLGTRCRLPSEPWFWAECTIMVAFEVLVHHTLATLRPTCSESIELCVCRRWVN